MSIGVDPTPTFDRTILYTIMIQTIKKLPVVVSVVLPGGRWGTSEAGRWSLRGDDNDEDRRHALVGGGGPRRVRARAAGATNAAPVETPVYSHAQIIMCTHTHDVETPLPLTPTTKTVQYSGLYDFSEYRSPGT